MSRKDWIWLSVVIILVLILLALFFYTFANWNMCEYERESLLRQVENCIK